MIYSYFIKDIIANNDISVFSDANTISMEPFIVGKVKLIISNCKINDLKVGDICVIIFDTGELVCHRVIFHNKNQIITKGDNGIFYDWATSEKDIVGIVRKVVYDSYYLDMTNKRNRLLNGIMVVLSKLKVTKRYYINSFQKTKNNIIYFLQKFITKLYKKSLIFENSNNT
ncbi:signal peptidase I [Marinitoga hydrogenitolerans DSM 16785]|uniref:Signal peptidase I n=1 Tax=Marinitoga hydrogenitolerans (strain DSM 16785 / JCM 12826 / AT1271) TaxID=1122195 RepID=A0A1M5A361_MARH1|nr:S24/S26 family peptidase [Marinitoga hydrogenitolerans]SHF24292.1 signal peptidase I [Marinitoga hydrogenitolerans DSM 16785]